MIGLLFLIVVAGVVLALLLASILAWEVTHPPRRGVAWAVARGLPIDPSEAGLKFEEWKLDLPDGARLAVWDIDLRPDGAKDPDLTVIILHGWGRSREDSLTRLRPWRGVAGRAVLVDLRGHGRSEGGICMLGDRDRSDVVELIERVAEGPIVLAGHSMGACIALSVSTDERVSDRLACVVAYAPYEEVHVPMSNRLKLRGAVARPFTDLALVLLRLLKGIRRIPTVRTGVTARCPVLMVQGREDRVSPGDGVERMAHAIGADVMWIEGGRHDDTHVIDPHAHDSRLRDFARRALEGYRAGAAAGGAS